MRLDLYIRRGLEDRLKEAAKTFPAVVLTGARQVGKTTLLRHCFPKHNYVSLDRPLTAEQAEQDPEAFLREYAPPLIIDEIQYAPRLFRNLKIAIDSNRKKMGQYLLTGSQRFNLMAGVSESLAGRIALFELEGLSYLELEKSRLVAGLNLGSLSEIMFRGGFPELWEQAEKPVDLFLNSYIGTYLERDVRQLLHVSSLRDFERFMRACAIRTGQILNKSDLARDVGVSDPTIHEWLGVMISSGQIHLLEPWFGNLTKRLVKAPKLYMSDISLALALTGASKESLASSMNIGALWETYVYGELRKQIAFKSSNVKIWYYRDQSQYEIDFILESGHDLTLCECKWSDSPSGAEKNLGKVAAIFEKEKPSHRRVKSRVVISRARETFTTQSGLEFRSIKKLV